MRSFILGILYAFIAVVLIGALGRWLVPYLASISLVDYVAFSGIFSIGIAYLAYDGSSPANQDAMSLITHRELVSRDIDEQDRHNRISFTFSVGIAGVLLLLVSGLMAWLQ
ncbi:hypothetical protein HJ118_23140 [Vibrio parahaemolyticus]|uniref:hypothetical protein n=1 Tax=Vibrio sp. YYF0003 TaxID=3116646 RepID=UPI00046798AD|nr:hypothetical protein [Vibrio parahaemolyticus]MEE3880034.1 hypothetical protein [Vibrio sp. YYF0003]EJG1645716.1 hypothetical protein [Vibrio parahaemolyticus]EKC5524299.1 hypothetical protein [Vibrio parahaemolyticus]ELB2122238.1 hypothetical protein [Vibrio parahaemolyticus]